MPVLPAPDALPEARIARQAWLRAGAQVMLIGSASAAIGFVIGHLVTAVTGG